MGCGGGMCGVFWFGVGVLCESWCVFFDFIVIDFEMVNGLFVSVCFVGFVKVCDG